MILSGGDLEVPKLPIHEVLLARCLQNSEKDPENPAFISAENRGDSISFKEVVQFTIKISEFFVENGYKKGDVIMIATNNNWRFVVTCLGAWRAGLIVSGACPQFTEYEFDYQITDSTAKLIFCDTATHSTLRKAAPNHKIIVFDTEEYSKILKTAEKSRKMPEISMDDLLYLPYSSGTTGKPKGVMISHGNFVMMVMANVKKIGELTVAHGLPEDFAQPQDLHFLPLYHAMGMFKAVITCYRGSTQIMFAKFNLELMLQLIEEFSILGISMVPAILVRLVNSPLLQKYDISSLISIASGSAPLPQGTIDKLKEILPDVKIQQGYGMTELTFASHLPAVGSPEGSVGKLMAGTFMKVLKGTSGELCGPNEQGELWIKGPQVMKGYWKKPELMRDLIDSDGFMRTGDIVYFDKDGNTFICDRIKELIKVNGKQVAPAEIESLMMKNENVADCCVFGIDDEKCGEIPVACVVFKGASAHHDDIIAHVNSKLAAYKRIRILEIVPEVLRNATGKILRRTMKENYLKKRKLSKL
ncbi:unnamed protein product [Caenorhabditis angaria]|uniref:Acetyl-CoA synthetase-like protein n=1 Tax=Caenorhabditis angaria TaxID=860376 RepID=A0A9P1MYF5_9PELO|nr:unnamed protein product [Caenorhabditis angaria]